MDEHPTLEDLVNERNGWKRIGFNIYAKTIPSPDPRRGNVMNPGDEVIVFDNKLWGGRDVGDNSQFWKPATIIEVITTKGREEIATVRFHHDDRISHGHFTNGMKTITEGPKMSNTQPVVQLVIRDPDFENHYVTDGSIRTIEIDVGSNWNGYKDFCSEINDPDSMAAEYERDRLNEVKDLPADSKVRAAVENFFVEAHDYYKS